MQRRIEQLLLVRAGHLVDDLAPTDAEVIEWLRQLEDGRADLERQAMLAAAKALQPDITLPEDQVINLLHTHVFEEAAESPEPAIAREILAGRYFSKDVLPGIERELLDNPGEG